MKKHLLLLILALTLVGCSAEKTNDSDSTAAVGTGETVVAATTTVATTTSPKSTVPVQTVKPVEVDFKGITSDAVTPKLGNLAINIKLNYYAAAFCPNTESGDIYYTNFKDNSFLYKMSGEKSTLLVDKPANFINYMNGNIYFICALPKVDGNYTEGSIYKLNLQTNKCELVLEAKATTLIATEDKLYYTEYAEEATTDGYRLIISNFFLPIEGGTPVSAGNQPYMPYKDYQYAWNTADGVNCFENINTKEKVNIDVSTAYSCVYGDNYYSLWKGLNVLNLKTGEDETYERHDFDEMMQKASALFEYESAGTWWDYTVIGNKLYIPYDGTMLCIDTDTDKAKLLTLKPKQSGANGLDVTGAAPDYRLNQTKEFVKLFTDGKRLFALQTPNGALIPEKLVEVIPDGDYIAVKDFG